MLILARSHPIQLTVTAHSQQVVLCLLALRVQYPQVSLVSSTLKRDYFSVARKLRAVLNFIQILAQLLIWAYCKIRFVVLDFRQPRIIFLTMMPQKTNIHSLLFSLASCPPSEKAY